MLSPRIVIKNNLGDFSPLYPDLGQREDFDERYFICTVSQGTGKSACSY